MDNEKISPLAYGILQGLKEAIADADGEPVDGIKKSVVYRVQPQMIRQQLNMSQSQFANAFGIPLRTLQGWEQGRRKIDMTTASYLAHHFQISQCSSSGSSQLILTGFFLTTSNLSADNF